MVAVHLYHIHFTADADEPIPPVAELPSIEAGEPQKAVEAMLVAGRYPQDPSIRWARVVVGFYPDGSPGFLLRFPVHVERTEAAMDWELLGSDSF